MENIIEALEWALNNTKPERPELQSDHFNILTNALNEAKNLSLNSTPSDGRLLEMAKEKYPIDYCKKDAGGAIHDANEYERKIFLDGLKTLRDTYPAKVSEATFDQLLYNDVHEALHKEIGHIFSDNSIVYTNILNRLEKILSPLSVGKSVGSDNREAVGFYKFVTENYFEKNTVFFSYDSHAYVDFEKYGETDEPFFTLEQLYQEFKSKQ
jgi:hypothetical protein